MLPTARPMDDLCLKASGCAQVLWEPWNVFCRPENRDGFAGLAARLDIVSPSPLQARRLTGLHDARDVMAALLWRGVRGVALRRGEAGSLVARQGGGLPVAVPAWPGARVVDVTGAGNAYRGWVPRRAGRDGRPGGGRPLRRGVGVVRGRAVRCDVSAPRPADPRGAPPGLAASLTPRGRRAMLNHLDPPGKTRRRDARVPPRRASRRVSAATAREASLERK